MKPQDVLPQELISSPLSLEHGDRFGRLSGFGGARLADLEPLEPRPTPAQRQAAIRARRYAGLMARKVRR